MTKSKDYSFSEKWSPEIEQYNFTQVPNLLLECQGHLQLTDGELLTLIHLLTFWFSHESTVYPSITTLTKFAHKAYPTVQRRLMRLEKKGFLKRRPQRGTSNTYDLIPCIKKLYQHQKVCTRLPRKQGDYETKARRLPPSFSITKEDQELKRPNFKNTENIFANYPFADESGKVWTI